MHSINDQVIEALITSYKEGHVEAAVPVPSGRFAPSTSACDFEVILHEIERRGWVYEHASTRVNGLRGHSFWIGEREEDEAEVTRTLAGDEERLSPTRLEAGCKAFIEAVNKAETEP